ncbi:MAG: hypothetical protein M1839_004452 [Geoglossum umbratile]|nr:MAG: hypothetical protein M1839_004452 [Geoglossum umbratile]
MKPNVLILCTGNSCRSHMAEGILRAAAGNLIDVHSVGSNPAGFVHPKAIEVLEEIDTDISAHTSKHLDTFLDRQIATVITVNRYHWGFDDPAHAKGSDEEVLAEFRRVRDEIRKVFEAYAAGLREGARAKNSTGDASQSPHEEKKQADIDVEKGTEFLPSLVSGIAL